MKSPMRGAVAGATGTLFGGMLTAVLVLAACPGIAALQKEPGGSLEVLR